MSLFLELVETRALLQASKPEYAVYILRELQVTDDEVTRRYHELAEKVVSKALAAVINPDDELSRKLYAYRQTVIKRTELGIVKTRLRRHDDPLMYQAALNYELLVGEAVELKRDIKRLAKAQGLDADVLIQQVKRPHRPFRP